MGKQIKNEMFVKPNFISSNEPPELSVASSQIPQDYNPFKAPLYDFSPKGISVARLNSEVRVMDDEFLQNVSLSRNPINAFLEIYIPIGSKWSVYQGLNVGKLRIFGKNRFYIAKFNYDIKNPKLLFYAPGTDTSEITDEIEINQTISVVGNLVALDSTRPTQIMSGLEGSIKDVERRAANKINEVMKKDTNTVLFASDYMSGEGNYDSILVISGNLNRPKN